MLISYKEDKTFDIIQSKHLVKQWLAYTFLYLLLFHLTMHCMLSEEIVKILFSFRT